MKVKSLSSIALLISSSAFADTTQSDRTNEHKKDVVDNVMVVTAQRYEQTAKDVPMSINVFDEKKLNDFSVDKSKDVLKYIPNVSLSGDGGFMAFPTIRGIGAGIHNVEQSVAIYIDDVYQGSPRSFGMMLLDLEQVEVLRGPQGALYGRNALGGAIKYVERKPDEFLTTDVDTSGGNLGYDLVKIGQSLPLVNDKLYSRISVAQRNRAGHIKNSENSDLGGFQDKAARIKLLGYVNENVDIQTNFHWTKEHASTANYLSEEKVKKDAHFNLAKPFFVDKINRGIDFKVNYIGYDVDFHSISSYNTYGFTGNKATGNFQPFPTLSQWSNIKHKQFSQEFRLTNKDNDQTIMWTTGLFFYRAEEDYRNGSQFSPMPAMDSYADNTTTSYAMYGKADYKVTPSLVLGFGGRVTHDRKTGKYHVDNGGPMFKPKAHGSLSKTDFSPRIDLTWKLTDQLNYYAAVSKGYKAGGFNVAFISPDKGKHEYQPEKSWAYETGLKGVFFDQKLSISSALFYTDWRNQQVLEYTGDTADIVNSKKSKSKGGELEINFIPMSGLDVGLGIGYTDAKFSNYHSIVDNSNANGKRIPFISKVNGTLYSTYRFDAGRGQIMLHGDMTYRSKTYFDSTNAYAQNGYTLVNLKMGYEQNKWGVYMFVNNAFDKLYRQTGHVEYGEKMAVVGDPRTFGVQFKANF